MKGIVFTEWIELVEDRYGLEICDQMIQRGDVDNDGAYTAIGTYDHQDFIKLVSALAEITETPIPELVISYGQHLFQRFRILYPEFFEGITSTRELLPLVESYIHVEVRKLYPDASLPTFTCTEAGDSLEVVYQSERPFADLAEGLIHASIEHFQDELVIDRTDLGSDPGPSARFLLVPRDVAIAPTSVEPCLN